MNAVRFSIVTPVYNGETTIARTIQSVLDQTVPPYEYNIVDGGSTDRTVEICNSYQQKFAEKGIRYQVISERDHGIYDGMNKGIRRPSETLSGSSMRMTGMRRMRWRPCRGSMQIRILTWPMRISGCTTGTILLSRGHQIQGLYRPGHGIIQHSLRREKFIRRNCIATSRFLTIWICSCGFTGMGIISRL